VSVSCCSSTANRRSLRWTVATGRRSVSISACRTAVAAFTAWLTATVSASNRQRYHEAVFVLRRDVKIPAVSVRLDFGEHVLHFARRGGVWVGRVGLVSREGLVGDIDRYPPEDDLWPNAKNILHLQNLPYLPNLPSSCSTYPAYHSIFPLHRRSGR
jgi:hypothetical protein